ncbi:programmed cell death 1 ligand 1-like [Maylandia zebra]|uniref:programmed cell death 1 ligand 1-like n=1 Tax=Maylandia zebra TaxID=106582 RepID=UPI00403C5775
MSAETASLCSTLLFVGLFVFVSAAQKNITVEYGQNVTLTCRAPNNNITAVAWSKTDLESGQVLLYRDGHFDTTNQHPSFKNRVDLQDRQMKDGDMSLILKNVTINDTGTYQCRVFTKGTNNKSISIIYLSVVPPGQTGGSVGLIIGLSVAAVVVVVAFLIYRKHKKVKKVNYQSTCSSQS